MECMCSERQFSLVQFTSADVNPGLELQGPDSGLGWGGRDDSFFPSDAMLVQ